MMQTLTRDACPLGSYLNGVDLSPVCRPDGSAKARAQAKQLRPGERRTSG
ncbi:hypothetical protein ACP76Z_02590 [Vibrio cholerae]